jgi:hypothetical protein
MNSSPSPPNTHENYFIKNESSTVISHKRERSLPISTNYGTSTDSDSCPKDDTEIYANVAEIELKKRADFIDHQKDPPIPGVDDEPIRVLKTSGWREYKTIGGRLVFDLFAFSKH